ncbi:MAG: hypothetical protein WBQ78_15895 [Gammaproteobacteria bacterium]
MKGHELRAAYGLGDGMNLMARLYLVEAITSVEDGNRFRIDFNYSFWIRLSVNECPVPQRVPGIFSGRGTLAAYVQQWGFLLLGMADSGRILAIYCPPQ